MKDKKFRARIFELVEQEVIQKFDKMEGAATEFYDEVENLVAKEEENSSLED